MYYVVVCDEVFEYLVDFVCVMVEFFCDFGVGEFFFLFGQEFENIEVFVECGCVIVVDSGY